MELKKLKTASLADALKEMNGAYAPLSIDNSYE